MLDDLLLAIRSCRGDGTPDGPEYAKCMAIAAIKPELFLGIAAQTWRLFTVNDVDGRAVLGEELT